MNLIFVLLCIYLALAFTVRFTSIKLYYLQQQQNNEKGNKIRRTSNKWMRVNLYDFHFANGELGEKSK